MRTGCHYLTSLSVCLSVSVRVSVYFLALAMPTSAGRFLVKFRLIVLGTALLTKMLMVLWSPGTCSRATNMCAVVRPLYLPCGKTLPGFRTPLSFRSRVGPWVRYLRQLTAVELHHQLVDADARTRAVFGLWALRVDSALQHEDSVAAIGN